MNPNRQVPTTTQTCITFGGYANQFGWILLGFGLIFARLMVPMVDLSFFEFMGELEQQQGKVTKILYTNFSINERNVREIHYTFEWEGAQHKGFSFSTQSPSVQSSVRVQFKKHQPQVSRIVGMRYKPAPPWLLFVLIFPLAGLISLYFGYRRTARVLPLLRKGIYSSAVLRHKERTNTSINNCIVMKYTFEFLDADSNVHEVIEKTHHYSTLEDDDEEPLLYMQDNPKHAALIDALPSSPKFDQHENICPAPWSQAIKVLIVPLIVIIGHGLWQ